MSELSRLRVGQGYDVHRLVEGRKLILGGVHIPSELGLLGHSDADALLHAITDAILGACSMGDIGTHFSDTDPQFEDADSGVLLQQVIEKATLKGFKLMNLDSTLICQSPKLAPHMAVMHQRVAQLCGLPVDSVNIKAKTNEKLGYLGRKEAIEAQAVVLMLRDK
ncbi:2-C-methyl-D-erythritol 2,4-cyclodiphosphate synthase [Limnobacter thiooxidans]|uniref:2-C-methyl-D-erythritol 2,4-cyclodiphosphate synthase n=1 Tax=Limnobacter thiooxidans TaxID=131080 RepID=A0AA86IZR8_9BURK|nr:2-C-methyl-D-erythritol 2,4-cyclodiphosphate synthase [Limnobacter thiooxidans]BET26343.1 2-C-methyl-D-erythritol 2,4-cyclodiphosphate synthase [Limnobacter thiooxidans]